MNAKEKIKHVKEEIQEKAQINPSGPFPIRFYDIVAYEEGPTILSRAEQWSIVQKLHQDGFLQSVEPDDSDGSIWVELAPPKEPRKSKSRRSNLFLHIKTIDQFLQHRDLVEKFRELVGDIKELKPGRIYVMPTGEEDDDVIQLLIDLKLVSYDWEKMKTQTHRDVGNRIIEFEFQSDAVLPVFGRISGKSGYVRKEVLELMAKEIGDRFTFNKLVDTFTDLGVPQAMFVQDTKWRAAFYILSYYATSQTEERLRLLKIIQEFLHPLMFGGDEDKAKETREKYAKWLKYDRVIVDDKGKVFLGPTEEEMDLGMDDWIDADGNVIEPKGYLLFPDHIAKLYVLWNQIVLLVGAYQHNAALDRKTLEKLYLEVIGKVEDLIYYGKLGSLKETYKRPFSSLSTADIEAQAQKENSAIELIVSFLMKITALEPDPGEIAKAKESNSDLIDQIIDATRAVTGEKIDLTKLTYDQALFLLRLTVGHLFDVLEAVSTGYLTMTDHQLNAKYVLLSDNLQGLLQRKDFEELKKSAPPDLPKHLFEALDEMDVWWEYGGKAGMMSFVGDIETAWIRAGQQTIPLPGWLLLHFSDVDTLIAEHRKIKSEKWKRIEQNIDAQKERGEVPFGREEKDESELIELKLAAGTLELNKATGSFRLNEVKGSLNPESQEFKVLLALATNKNRQATYSDLLGANASKVSKRNLTFVVRNLKETLGILPAKGAKNKDVIANLKRHGYRLIT